MPTSLSFKGFSLVPIKEFPTESMRLLFLTAYKYSWFNLGLNSLELLESFLRIKTALLLETLLKALNIFISWLTVLSSIMAISSLRAPKEALRISKELIKELQNTSPNTKGLTEKLNSLCLKGYITPWGREDIDQEVYKNFQMALNRHEFETGDLSTVLYWLTRARFEMSEANYSRIESQLLDSKLTSESAYKLINVYGTINRPSKKVLNHIVSSLEDFKGPKALEAAVNLCVLKYYNSEFWKKLGSNFQPSSQGIQNSRIIQLALSQEAPSLLEGILFSGESLSSYLKKLSAKVPIIQETSTNSQLVSSQSPHSKIHQEIKYILLRMRKEFSENANLLDTYVVDFESKGLVIDADGPMHYMKPARGETFDTVAKNKLIGQVELKYRLLKSQGYKIVNIPFFEWNRYFDQVEKTIYTKRKLRLVN